MRDTALLQLALGMTPPWTVRRACFDPEAHRLDIDFSPGSRFACPAYDTERKIWRHLNFFQHQAYLSVRVPRIRCDTCGIKGDYAELDGRGHLEQILLRQAGDLTEPHGAGDVS